MKSESFLPQSIFEKLTALYEKLPENTKSAEKPSPFAASLEQFLEISGGERELSTGEILFVEGDPGDNLYWIETGVVAVMQGSLDHPRILAFRHPGQVVGEIALLENIHRTATIAAIAPTHLKTLSKEKFQAMLGLIPDMGIELMRLMSARLREIQPAEYSDGMYDHLTGALSRQAFDSRLPEEIERAQLYRYNFSMVFLDLDKFKEVNDTYGHTRGDEVLINFVQRVTNDLRTTDLLFRYGGDEFVLLLQGIDHHRGPLLVQRLLDEFASKPIPGDPPLSLSFSAGIAYYPSDGNTSDELLKTADERVYHSKRGGRGLVTSLQETGSASRP